MLRRSPDEAGFVLPLALAGVLVLWHSSLSLQAAVLHSRRLHHLEQERVAQLDQLASAAQVWADWLSGTRRCLRSIPSLHWSQSLPLDCPAELKGIDLRSIHLGGQSIRLLSWNPEQGHGTLTLQLADSGVEARFALGPFGVRELG